jgi:hypothetical protein
MAKGIRNMTTTKAKGNTIVLNLLLLASSNWILADVMLIASLSQPFLNNHMKWYQGLDPNISRLGFLAFHGAVQYFLMLEDLLEAERSWETHKLFDEFPLQVAKINNENLQKLKEYLVIAMIHEIILQVCKHQAGHSAIA